MPAMLTEALRCATGRGNCREWPDYFAQRRRPALGDAMNMMVGLREFGSAAKIAVGLEAGSRGYEGPGSAPTDSTRLSARAGSPSGQGRRRVLQGAQPGRPGWRSATPAAQVQRSVDGFVALEHGKTHNPAALPVRAAAEESEWTMSHLHLVLFVLAFVLFVLAAWPSAAAST